ncbi:carbohydrate ABC transporter membrane protein 1, CUT1 family [Glycomyces sambucus]|uniref:Maltose/maltodextrin transport system permease protein n=1 Tax=Glycomyces sambucus TaxID=380244 RepID=A0A1G9H6G5_9ACTN|nr:ABC transporter permease subunit [Glycomyces sambucus]SDL08482.1 carbohydrate ABC transporter membrane protein 1, CUT1 family [Glycomyces sambucus]
MLDQRSRTAGSTTAAGLIIKIGVLAVVAALAVWAALPLIAAGAWWGLALEAVVVAVLFFVYLQRRAIQLKYLIPGTLLLIAFQILPVVLTIGTSFSNYGDGHRVDKEQATEAIIAAGVQQTPGGATYLLAVGESAAGDLTLLLTDTADGSTWAGTAEGLTELDGATVDPTGRITAAPDYTVWTLADLNERQAELAELAVPTGEETGIKVQGLSAFEGQSTRSYDEACDCITDTANGTVWYADDETGSFLTEDGQAALVGWRVNIGADNYLAVITDPDIRGPFLGVFTWNVMFAAGSVLFTFAIGLGTAMALNRPGMRGTKVYRAFMILPYAMPSFAMLLVWAQMFNRDFGLVNELFNLNVAWYDGTWSARAMVLIANTWLGWPYMFLISLGALQALPSDSLEAAKIDGATGITAFRKITLPLLLIALTPLLISSFAFNFNNFNAIELLSGGHPFAAGDAVGGTDLLITYAFRQAFGSSSADYGFASAISVFIFLIVATISAFMFRFTRSQEDVYS